MKRENENVEFKKSLAMEEEIKKTICAFANSKGGTIFIGVDDSGKVVGVDIGKNTIENISNSIYKSFEPPIFPEINVQKIEDKDVIEIKVKESLSKPHFYKGVAYKRVGNTNQRMSPSEIRDTILRSGNITFDAITSNFGLNEIDENTIKGEFERIGKKFRDLKDVLFSLNLLDKDKLKNAAILLFGKHVQNFFPQAVVKFVKKDQHNQVVFMDIIEGNIFQQLHKVEDLFYEHLPYTVTIKGFQRIKDYNFPFLAVREAFLNALAHRDYSFYSYIYIELKTDSLEIVNPGILPKGISVADLYESHKSVLRNPIIANVLHRFGYIEAWGEGTLRILEESKKKGIFVKFAEDYPFFKVEFSTKKYPLDEVDRKIIEFIKEKGQVKSSDIAKALKIPKRTVRYKLSNLILLGYVNYQGDYKKRVYFV